jgi:hypothetical protein
MFKTTTSPMQALHCAMFIFRNTLVRLASMLASTTCRVGVCCLARQSQADQGDTCQHRCLHAGNGVEAGSHPPAAEESEKHHADAATLNSVGILDDIFKAS